MRVAQAEGRSDWEISSEAWVWRVDGLGDTARARVTRAVQVVSAMGESLYDKC